MQDADYPRDRRDRDRLTRLVVTGEEYVVIPTIVEEGVSDLAGGPIEERAAHVAGQAARSRVRGDGAVRLVEFEVSDETRGELAVVEGDVVALVKGWRRRN